MSFLFDTNACIAYLNNHLSPIRRKLEQISSKQVFICSVVKAELFYGAMKSKNPAQTLAKQSVFLNQFVSLPMIKQQRFLEKFAPILRVLVHRLGLMICKLRPSL